MCFLIVYTNNFQDAYDTDRLARASDEDSEDADDDDSSMVNLESSQDDQQLKVAGQPDSAAKDTLNKYLLFTLTFFFSLW